MTDEQVRDLARLRCQVARVQAECEREAALRREEIEELLRGCDHRRPDGGTALAGITIRCALCGRFVDSATARAHNFRPAQVSGA